MSLNYFFLWKTHTDEPSFNVSCPKKGSNKEVCFKARSSIFFRNWKFCSKRIILLRKNACKSPFQKSWYVRSFYWIGQLRILFFKKKRYLKMSFLDERVLNSSFWDKVLKSPIFQKKILKSFLCLAAF